MRIPSIPGFNQQAFEKYLKNTGWYMMAKVGSLVINMVISTFILSIYLGTEKLGILSYPPALMTFFLAIAALGLDGFVTRELLNHPEKKNALLGTAFRLRLIAGFAVIPIVCFLYWLINRFIKPQDTPFYYVFIVSFTCAIQAFNIIESFFQSQVRAKYIMYVQVISNVLSALIKLVLILLKLSLTWFIYSLVLDAALIATGYLIAYNANNNRVRDWGYDGTLAKYLMKHSWPLAFSAILSSLYMKIDQVMIPWYQNTDQLGIYATVARLSESWYFIPTAIVGSVFPSIMLARKTDIHRYHKRLQNMYDLMVVMSVSIAIFMTFASKYVYHIIYHKHPEFWPGASVLSVHVWAGIFVFLGVASSQYLIAEGFTKLAMVRTGAGAILNVILNIWWLPRYGIMGAAYATLAAYFIATFFIVFIPRTRQQGLIMFKSLFLISLFQKIFRR